MSPRRRLLAPTDQRSHWRLRRDQAWTHLPARVPRSDDRPLASASPRNVRTPPWSRTVDSSFFVFSVGPAIIVIKFDRHVRRINLLRSPPLGRSLWRLIPMHAFDLLSRVPNKMLWDKVWEKTGSNEAFHEIGEGAHLGRRCEYHR